MLRPITAGRLFEDACLGRLLRGLCGSSHSSDTFALELQAQTQQQSPCGPKAASGAAADAASRGGTAAAVTAGLRATPAAQLTSLHAATLHTSAGRAAGTLASAEPAAAVRSMPISPGSQVVLELRQSAADVQILTNDDPEAISWEDGRLLVEEVPPGVITIALGAGAAAPADSGPIVLRIPPRFCSVDISTGGGSVQVQAIKEGSLTVESNGGDVHVGSMAGATAELLTAGGNVTGSVTAEKVFVHTDTGTGAGSGDVRLDKLLAKEALILARDVNSDTPQAARTRRGARWGAVHVTALYAEEAHIKTGGAPISIGTLSCSADGTFLSGGGPVTVGGLDGTLLVISGGGAVDLQLQRNVAEVHVNSMADAGLLLSGAPPAASGGGADATPGSGDALGGTISCKVDPSVSAVLATCCDDLHVDAALPFEAKLVKDHVITAHIGPAVGGTDAKGLANRAVNSAAQHGGGDDATAAAAAAAPTKHISLDAGNRGRIEVSARGWFDSVKEKFGSGQQGDGNGAGSSVASEARDGSGAWVPPS